MNQPDPTSDSMAKPSELRNEMSTHRNGRWRMAVRVSTVSLGLFSIGLFVFSILWYIATNYAVCMGTVTACYAHGQLTPGDVQSLQELGLSIQVVALYPLVLDTILALGYWSVAGFLFWRRSQDRVALLAAVSLSLFPIVFNYGLTSALPSPWWFLANVLSFLGSLSFLLFFFVFPSGHFAPSWTPWALAVAFIYWGLNEFFATAAFNPFYRFQVLNGLMFLGLLVTVLAAQIYRYLRVSNQIQRQQTKWVVYGASIAWGGYLVLFAISLFFPSLFSTGSLMSLVKSVGVYLLLLLIPVSSGMAITRSRLWEIDFIINRTLVYAGLSVGVVGVYVLVVGSLGTLIGTRSNLFIDLIATGLVAILFQPLREWLQRSVNHLLYGQRDEPYAVITQLSQRLERSLAPNAVLSTIVETVAQALKLPYVAILLKQEHAFQLSASAGELVGDPVVLPLLYQQEIIGQMQLAPRTPGEPFTPADRHLLDELVRQAGLAAHAVQLAADLQRSHGQLEQRVQERTRELTSLLEISHTVASTLQLKPLLGLILDQLKLVIDYTGASILTLEGEDLVYLDHQGPVPQEELVRLRFPLAHLGPVWESISLRSSVLVSDIHEETEWAQALRVTMGDLITTTFKYVCSWMGVPLVLRDRVIGMLVLTSTRKQAFSEHHAMLALAIANQAAIAIENARLYEQAQELAAVQERQKLARELHDSVSQSIYSIALGLHSARIQIERDPQRLPASLDDLLSLAEAALAEMRALIFELRPESLEREGLVSALTKQGAAIEARYGMDIQTDLCEEPPIPLTVKQELYRIAQEALNNTVKHAHARKVDVLLRQTSEMVILEVRDDGVGFDPRDTFPGHLGLHSMQERVSSLGGKFQLESAPGQGAHLLAQVPLGSRDDA